MNRDTIAAFIGAHVSKLEQLKLEDVVIQESEYHDGYEVQVMTRLTEPVGSDFEDAHRIVNALGFSPWDIVDAIGHDYEPIGEAFTFHQRGLVKFSFDIVNGPLGGE